MGGNVTFWQIPPPPKWVTSFMNVTENYYILYLDDPGRSLVMINLHRIRSNEVWRIVLV